MGGPVANCLGGGMHMQTCKHEDIKKTEKPKGTILQATGFEPRTPGTRGEYYYQLSYVRIWLCLQIREYIA